MVVCLPGAKIEAITERVENFVGSGKGGSVLVHVGTNNVEREGTTAIVRKYRQLVRTLKQTRAAVFADELSAAVDSGMGTMTNIFGSKHCLN